VGTNMRFWSYLAQIFLEREVFHTNVLEKIKTLILCSITFMISKFTTFMGQWGKIL